MILSPALGDIVTAGSQSCDQKSTVPSYTVPSSLFVKSTVLNPESNILVSMVQPYDYSCTAVHYMYEYSLDLQLCTQLYDRTTSTTKFSTAVDR